MFRILAATVSRQQLLLALGDLVCILLSLFTAQVIYIGYQVGYDLYHVFVYMAWPTVFIISVHMMFFYFVDAYNLKQDMLSFKYFTSVVLAIGVSLIFVSICFFLFPAFRYGRAVTFIHVLFLTVYVMAWRHVFVRLTHVMRGGRRVLIVGMERCTRDIIHALRSGEGASHLLLGYVSEEGQRHPDTPEGVSRLGGPADVAHIIARHRVQEIVLAPSAEKNSSLVKTLIHASYEGVVVIDAVSFYERLTGKIPFDHLTDIWLLSQSLGNVRFFQWRLKRVTDVFLALVGLALGAVPLALAALAVKLTSRGPVFYRQERVGRNNMPFTLIKLRTMVADAEQQTGAVFAARNDPRITPVGRFLRKTRLDEVPQLWNVLKGDMSLIGPRPERPQFVEQLDKKVPYYSERHAVRPGVTGWAQVKYPYAATLEETKEKLQYDLYYIKNMSLFLDCLILVMTVKTVLFAKGR